MTRIDVLSTIKQAREGRKGKLDWAYSLGAMPEIDYRAFLLANPRLNSRNRDEQREAWLDFFKSEIGAFYRVAPTVRQVRRSHSGVIVR